MKKQRIRYLIYFLSGCIILYLLFYFFFNEKEKFSPTIEVTVAKVLQRDVSINVHTLGTVQAYATVDIKSMVTGPLLSTSFKEGDVVEQGQVLFTIDPRPFTAAVSQAKANLARDQATFTNYQLQVSRNNALLKKGYVAKQDYDTINANMKAAAATVKADEAALENAELQLAYSTIRAPIPGKTGNILLKPGSVIKANDTVSLVTINQINPIYIAFSLPQTRLHAIQNSLRKGVVHVTAIINDERLEKGEITFIDNTVDITTGTIQLKATFANKERKLWPGQFVTVEVPIEHVKNAVLIPSPALLTGQNGFYVFVLDKNNVTHMKIVKPGDAVGEDTIITQGLTPGETIVTSGQLRLKEGSKVNINTSREAH